MKIFCCSLFLLLLFTPFSPAQALPCADIVKESVSKSEKERDHAFRELSQNLECLETNPTLWKTLESEVKKSESGSEGVNLTLSKVTLVPERFWRFCRDLLLSKNRLSEDKALNILRTRSAWPAIIWKELENIIRNAKPPKTENERLFGGLAQRSEYFLRFSSEWPDSFWQLIFHQFKNGSPDQKITGGDLLGLPIESFGNPRVRQKRAWPERISNQMAVLALKPAAADVPRILNAVASNQKWTKPLESSVWKLVIQSLKNRDPSRRKAAYESAVGVLSEREWPTNLVNELYELVITDLDNEDDFYTKYVTAILSMRPVWPAFVTDRLISAAVASARPNFNAVSLLSKARTLDEKQKATLVKFIEKTALKSQSASAILAWLEILFSQPFNAEVYLEVASQLADAKDSASHDALLTAFGDCGKNAQCSLREKEVTEKIWDHIPDYLLENEDTRVNFRYGGGSTTDSPAPLAIQFIETHREKIPDRTKKKLIQLKSNDGLKPEIKDRLNEILSR